MRIFVYESTCAGECPLAFEEPSLLAEGRAMLVSVLQDLLNIVFAGPEDPVVHTIWDPRCGPIPMADSGRLIVTSPRSNQTEIDHYRECCAGSDLTLIIAPEWDGILQERCEIASQCGGITLNCQPAIVGLCSDKLRLNEHLARQGIKCLPAISMTSLPKDTEQFVIKPRYGVGSIGIDMLSRAELLEREIHSSTHIVQPFIAGRALSVGLIFGRTGQLLTRLPVAVQHLSTDGHFSYLGGEIPASGITNEMIDEIVEQVAQAIHGLRGYVGIDMIQNRDYELPILVEINPRLTTSYVGYRAAMSANIMECLLQDKACQMTVVRSVAFTSGGQIQVLDRI